MKVGAGGMVVLTVDDALPSKAHRLFFIKMTSRGLFKLDSVEDWAKQLKVPVTTYRRCIAAGLIIHADVRQIIDHKFKKDELISHLRSRGLKVSGDKVELIDRLLEAETDWYQIGDDEKDLYMRTEAGQRLADDIYEAIGRETVEAEYLRVTGRTLHPQDESDPAYSPEQIDIIKAGIVAGRAAMEKRGPHPAIFIDAFMKANGMQVPGRPDIPDSRLRVLGSAALMILEGGGEDIFKNWTWITEDMKAAVYREIGRAFMEPKLMTARALPRAYAWRFSFRDDVPNIERYRRFAECDNFGLGQGVFPLDEVFVFQPIYDKGTLELVYQPESSPPENGKPASIWRWIGRMIGL